MRVGSARARPIYDVGFDATLSRGGVDAVPSQRLSVKRRGNQHRSNEKFAVHFEFCWLMFKNILLVELLERGCDRFL